MILRPVIPAKAGIQKGGSAVGFPPLCGGNVGTTKGAHKDTPLFASAKGGRGAKRTQGVLIL